MHQVHVGLLKFRNAGITTGYLPPSTLQYIKEYILARGGKVVLTDTYASGEKSSSVLFGEV